MAATSKSMTEPNQGKTASPRLLPGARFGNYEVRQRLGVGGMGEVYRARDTRLERDIAIKILSSEQCCQPEALVRFEREARSACALNHPNIVTIYEIGEVNGTRFIAMEVVNGQTLRELLALGPIPFRTAAAIAAQIANALAKAHNIGLVHRDLKPENLMITDDGIAKILDFGLAKLRVQSPAQDPNATISAITGNGAVMGTIGYMSPEQATGREVDFRSDQFSFGSVLYEMVTGYPAFRKNTHAESMAAILRDEPERAKMIHAPPPFLWIVERCVAKDPKQRYASTSDLARDLAAVRDRLVEAPARESQPRINNLPTQRNAFIGREREAAELRRLLSQGDVQLVTLTGPGGIGKTRLILQVAAEVASEFSGGVCFVPLSSVGEHGVIISTIAKTMGVRESANQTEQEGVNEYLAGLDQPLLLVLDNFEHLVSAAPIVSQLLSAGPKLKIAVTSQAPLHVYGEHEFPVPPLAMPDLKSIPAVDVLSRLPSVALFVERATAVKHEFALTRENAQAVAAICARLDGLPLAIELAAARIKILPPPDMLARLESRLKLLTGGARDLPTRQQTLRSTVDWSYGLLNAAEQTLFRRLSVFVGGCTLEGVESVCDTMGDLGVDVLDGMASMVDKSLVQHEVDTETRFTFLSTIREYALEHLAAGADESATRRAHAAYYLVLAEEGAHEVTANSEWLDLFELEHENFRAALDYLTKIADADWSLRLGAALFRFWETREYFTEGRDTIERLLSLERTSPRPKLRARLQFAAAVLAGEQGDFDSARQLFEDSLESCVELNDNRGVAVALNALAVQARNRGELTDASSLFERCLEIWKDIGDSSDIARSLSNLANVTKLQGDYARASSLYDECLAMFRKAEDGAGVAWTLNYQGDVARESANFVAARSFCEQSLNLFRQLRDTWGIASALSDLAGLSYDQGNNADARRLYAESILLFRDLGHKRGVARVLECLAASAAAQSNAEQALRWAAAAAALRERLGAPLTPTDQARLEKALDFARRALGGPTSLTAWIEGWVMPLEEAIKEASNSGENGNSGAKPY
jgi:predicted ATPase